MEFSGEATVKFAIFFRVNRRYRQKAIDFTLTHDGAPAEGDVIDEDSDGRGERVGNGLFAPDDAEVTSAWGI